MIAERLGLEPTRITIKGQPLRADPRYREPFNHFVLEVDRTQTVTSPGSAGRILEAVVEELLHRIEPVANRLDEIRDRVSLELMCAYGSSHKLETIRLSDALLQRITALKLPFALAIVPHEEK